MHATAQTYQPGDRVLFRTTLGELPATVRDASHEPAGWVLYLVEVDGTPFPRMLALGSQLRPLDDQADAPLIVPTVP
jgi:hypothetical protein